jgi:hypothetical protein
MNDLLSVDIISMSKGVDSVRQNTVKHRMLSGQIFRRAGIVSISSMDAFSGWLHDKLKFDLILRCVQDPEG